MSKSKTPDIDNSLFEAAIKKAPSTPTQKAVIVEEKLKPEKQEKDALKSMYFKIDKRLKKDLDVYLAEEDMYIQHYLHDLIMNDLADKGKLKSFD